MLSILNRFEKPIDFCLSLRPGTLGYIEDLIERCKEFPGLNVNTITFDYYHMSKRVRDAQIPSRLSQIFPSSDHIKLKNEIVGQEGLWKNGNGQERYLFVYQKLSNVLKLTEDINSKHISLKVSRLILDVDQEMFKELKYRSNKGFVTVNDVRYEVELMTTENQSQLLKFQHPNGKKIDLTTIFKVKVLKRHDDNVDAHAV
jgi:hypothetical protein